MAGFDGFFITIPDPGTNNSTRSRQTDFVRDNQIDGITPLENPDVGVILRLADEGGFDFFAGSIRSVQDTSMAMTAFTGQVIAFFTVGLNLRIKQDALID